jgi:hypothetical protein
MPTGVLSSFDLTVGVKVNMDESIYVLSPLDSPMINGTDADGLSVISSAPVNETEFFWMDENILVPRSSLGGTVTTAGTDLILASAADRLKFSTGDVVKVATVLTSEIIRVTGYSVTTATNLLVTKGYDGTTSAQHLTGATVIGLGTALPEGSDPEAARAQDRSSRSNYTQIFGPTLIHLTATEQVVGKYGVSNEFARQVYNRMKENVIAREQAYIYGRKTTSTTTEIRTTGGLVNYITTNTDTTSTQLTVATVQAMQQLAFNQGGVWDRLMANPGSLGDLNLTTDTSRVRQEVQDSRRGRVPTMEILTEFGGVSVVRNRWMHPFDAVGFARENVIRRVMRPLVLERLAKTGDSDKAQIVCEEGLEVKGESHGALFRNLTYTAA